MLRSAKFVLSLGAALIVAGAAHAAPKEAASDGKVCQAGVGKPYVMPMFANGKAVSSCEVGNAGFFGRSCAQPAKLVAAASGSASGCCAAEKSAAVKVAKHEGCCGSDKAAAKVAKHDGCGEKALGVMACEVGNRHFFTAAACGESAPKVAKATCCSAK